MISCIKNLRGMFLRIGLRSMLKTSLINFSSTGEINPKEELEDLFYKTNYNVNSKNLSVLKPTTYDDFNNMIKEDKALLVLYLAPYFNSGGAPNVLCINLVSRKLLNNLKIK